MSLRTPLGRVRGLGSAKSGVSHWWMQRLTAIALIPLSLWFVGSLVALASADYMTVVAWMRQPLVAVLLILFIIALFQHAQLGVQVVFEDYVHTEWLKVTSLVLLKLLAFLLGAVSVFSVLRIALGG